jgi:phosphatidate cytidylyltransferase
MDPSPWNQSSGSVGRGDEYADTGRIDMPYGDYPSDGYESPAGYDYGATTPYGTNGYTSDHYDDSGYTTTRYDEPQNYDDLRNAAPSTAPEDEHATGRSDSDDRDGDDRPPPRRGGPARRGGEPAEAGTAAPSKGRAGRNLPAAIGVGVVLAGAVVASLLIVKAAFLGIIVIAAGIACRELATALRTNGTRVPLLPLLVGAVGLQVAAYNGGAQAVGVAMALFVLVVLVWRMAEGAENFLRDATAGVFVAIYVPFLASFAALMTAEPNGARRVILFFLVTACSDTGGYASGVLSGGKHPMAPTISPKKSWEGLAGSVITAAAGGAVGMHFLLHGQFWQGAVVGVCAVASATLGDLAESMIKRDLGIKDMGNLLPGHGGLMDRMDSLLATAPVVWLLLAAFLGS